MHRPPTSLKTLTSIHNPIPPPSHNLTRTMNHQTTTSRMYHSLRLPWSPDPTPSEQMYRQSNMVKTKGTIFLQPPPTPLLRATFNSPPRPKTRMSSGAVALCKHFERGVFNRYGTTTTTAPAAGKTANKPSSEHNIPHPFWTLPTGSNENKTRVAGEVLDDMLRRAAWRNVMLLHAGVAVYEVRNEKGYGMRWTLEVVEDGDGDGRREGRDGQEEDAQRRGNGEGEDPNGKAWTVKTVTFRGFLEPIEGLDHELPTVME